MFLFCFTLETGSHCDKEVCTTMPGYRVDSFFFFFLVGLGFELSAWWAQYHLSHTSSPFCSGYFGDGVSRSICPGWSQTSILSVSASWVARITVMSQLIDFFFKVLFVCYFCIKILGLLSLHLFVFLFIFAVLNWTQGLLRAKQALYHLNHTPSPFFLIVNISMFSEFEFIFKEVSLSLSLSLFW
jgi:hypothetical protein